MLCLLQKASPNVQFNIIHVIYTYAYVANYYNGDYSNCPLEATVIFLDLCDNIRLNKNYENAQSAIASVTQNIVSVSTVNFDNSIFQIILSIPIRNIKHCYCFQCNWLPQDEQTLSAFKEAGDMIMQGPEQKNKYFYIAIALSELHRLIMKAKEEISKYKNKSGAKEFSKRFAQRYNVEYANLSKKTLVLHCKKLEYYLSWCKSQHIHMKT